MTFNFEFDIGTAIRLIGSDNTWYPIKSVSADRTTIKLKGLHGKFIKTHVSEYSNNIIKEKFNLGEKYRVEEGELMIEVGQYFVPVYENKKGENMNKVEMIRAYKFMVN